MTLSSPRHPELQRWSLPSYPWKGCNNNIEIWEGGYRRKPYAQHRQISTVGSKILPPVGMHFFSYALSHISATRYDLRKLTSHMLTHFQSARVKHIAHCFYHPAAAKKQKRCTQNGQVLVHVSAGSSITVGMDLRKRPSGARILCRVPHEFRLLPASVSQWTALIASASAPGACD